MGTVAKGLWGTLVGLLLGASPLLGQTSDVELGRAIFLDGSLSEPAGTSCAACHDPAHGYAGNNGSTNGVAAGSVPGRFSKRNTNSVRYLQYVPAFYFHWEEDALYPDAIGGLFWDGRADTIAAAVQQPLLNPNEMGDADAAQVMGKIAAAPYAAAFQQLYPGAAGNATATMTAIGAALQAFLTSPEMAPFSSRYDDYVLGKAPLSALEMQGLALFKDPATGGCAGCHKMDDLSGVPSHSLFTDYSFDAPGPPRNMKIPANADPTYFDLGLCARTDNPLVTDQRLCAQWRTPSLRNVATRQYFMHNGAFTTLRDTVNFYATRDTDPTHWFPPGQIFNDMPPADQGNINTIDVPYNQQLGDTPRLSDANIDAITAFLQTLTDADFR